MFFFSKAQRPLSLFVNKAFKYYCAQRANNEGK